MLLLLWVAQLISSPSARVLRARTNWGSNAPSDAFKPLTVTTAEQRASAASSSAISTMLGKSAVPSAATPALDEPNAERSGSDDSGAQNNSDEEYNEPNDESNDPLRCAAVCEPIFDGELVCGDKGLMAFPTLIPADVVSM